MQDNTNAKEVSREDKLEAIIEIGRYDRKLLDAMQVLSADLKYGRAKLPSDLLGTIMQGLNWTIAVLNQVSDVINEKEEKVDKEMINENLTSFQTALESQNEMEVSRGINEYLIPCVQQISNVAEQFGK